MQHEPMDPAGIRETVSRHLRRTPLLRSEWLSGLAGAEVHLKCENLQVTGSFKVRGALAAVSLLAEDERTEGVVACSAGNHGLGLAFAAKVFGIPCTVVVPRSAPAVKADGIAALGAKVIRSPHDGYDATHAWTVDRLGELGGRFVSPFDDPAIMAGNGGTLMLEVLEDLPDVDLMVIPCGGGGCSIGAAAAARGRGARPRIVAVNTDASPGMWLSRRDGKARLEVDSAPTIAEGLEGGVSENSFRLANEYVDDVVLAREDTVRRAVSDLFARERMVVEGSGAAGVAALLDGAVPLGEARRVCIVLTGSNIDRSLFLSLVGA